MQPAASRNAAGQPVGTLLSVATSFAAVLAFIGYDGERKANQNADDPYILQARADQRLKGGVRERTGEPEDHG